VGAKMMQIIAEGKTEGQAFEKQTKEAIMQPMKQQLVQRGPAFAMQAYQSMGNSRADQTSKAMLTNMVQELGQENRAWSETAKWMQVMQQHPDKIEQAAIMGEAQRKLVPKSTYEQGRDAEGRAQKP
jgi:hypothetical protein